MTATNPPKRRRHVLRGILVSGLVALAAAAVYGQPTGARTHAPAEIPRGTPDPLPRLIAERWDVADVTEDGIRVYLDVGQFEELVERGFAPRWLVDETALQWQQWIEATADKIATTAFVYPTYDEMTTTLHQWRDDFPGLFHLESAGRSVQGRELWFARVTGPPGAGPAFRPAVSHVSTMHGDEKAGTVLMMDFLERLLTGYGVDDDLTWMVDHTEIWVMPLMNPDGYTIGPTRTNANGRDLNRDFPSWTCGDPDTITNRQPETAAIMTWRAARPHVVLQANYHGGALVVNYPLDECSQCNTLCPASFHPENGLLRNISLTYAGANGRMTASTRFPQGVTNGAAWYAIYGSMQDWHLRYHGTVEVTVELDNTKIPGPTLLEQIVLENRQSVIDYTLWAQRGLRGVVIDGSGEPVVASVSVEGGDISIRTDPATGGFHRLLEPGAYTVTITPADSQENHTFTGVTVTDGFADPRIFQVGDAAEWMGWMLF